MAGSVVHDHVGFLVEFKPSGFTCRAPSRGVERTPTAARRRTAKNIPGPSIDLNRWPQSLQICPVSLPIWNITFVVLASWFRVQMLCLLRVDP